ncbi:MAG: dienelactone hydrolase [Sulfobacillus acidophilus]|uniref:Dihydrolipoamide acetyltransferase component of pyruvate dehydrogenase complex n=1 Tax=Sulfobacillus acidophilus TaxID=53633 RepID=A0A2T2WNC9_9FIRM|nr:MAG: dienelactone hydrolase [Sulfobacillus acidophilus]
MNFFWKLPDVGEGIQEAEILAWRVEQGQIARKESPLVEIQTDKAAVEIPSPVEGVVLALNAAVGDVVKVGTVLVEFDVPAGDSSQVIGVIQSKDENNHPKEEVAISLSTGDIRGNEEFRKDSGQTYDVLASPAVRTLAREKRVDLSRVRGTGPKGRILREDVLKVSEIGGIYEKPTDLITSANVVQPTRIALRGIRRVTAERMVRSAFTAPQVSVCELADISSLAEWKNRISTVAPNNSPHLTYLPFVVKAVVGALKKFPTFNAVMDDEGQEVVLLWDYDIGIAVDTDEGLIVPIIRGADRKNIGDIAQEITELARKAHSRGLSPSELLGGTFTISNYGAVGALFATALVNYPQVAILGIGRARSQLILSEDNRVVSHLMLPVVLTFDHRVNDGGQAGRFLAYIMSRLQEPGLLFLE